jgi:hypothetical protein
MTDWQKILLIKNLSKVHRDRIIAPRYNYYKQYYRTKDAIRDTLAYSGKSKNFEALYNFYITSDVDIGKYVYTYGYKTGDGDVVEMHRVKIKTVCKLKKVNND